MTRVLAAASILLPGAACARGAESATSSRPAGPLRVSLDTAAGAQLARVVVSGFGARELEALRSSSWDATKWPALLRVSGTGADSGIVAGAYMVSDTAVEFHPAPPLERGLRYAVRVDPSKLVVPRSDSASVSIVSLPAPAAKRVAAVLHLSPGVSVVPENLQRVRVQFSVPMSQRPAGEALHLIDASGRAMQDAFMPDDASSWSADRTVLSLPLRQVAGGHVLRAGRPYAVLIDSTWTTASGEPLAKPARVEFRAGPAITTPMPLDGWTVRAPRAGTRDPLIVTAPRALDRLSMDDAITISSTGPKGNVSGTVEIPAGDRAWRFTPGAPWRAGDYDVVVRGTVEDLAGNGVAAAPDGTNHADARRHVVIR